MIRIMVSYRCNFKFKHLEFTLINLAVITFPSKPSTEVYGAPSRSGGRAHACALARPGIGSRYDRYDSTYSTPGARRACGIYSRRPGEARRVIFLHPPALICFGSNKKWRHRKSVFGLPNGFDEINSFLFLFFVLSF